MVILDGMRICMIDESAQFDGSDYVANSTYDAMINEAIETLDESAAKEQAKAILQGEDAKKARQLLLEANKLYKTDKEASKKKSKEAIKILKKLRDEAKKIDDDNAVVQTCKSIALFFIPFIAAGVAFRIGATLAKLGNAFAGLIVGVIIGNAGASVTAAMRADKEGAKRTKMRRAIAKNDLSVGTVIKAHFTPVNKKAITRDAALNIIDNCIEFAEDMVEENSTFQDKIKNIADKKKTAGETFFVRGRD